MTLTLKYPRDYILLWAISICAIMLIAAFPINPGPALTNLPAKSDNHQVKRVATESYVSGLLKEIPVLCYHNIRDDIRPGEYTISISSFKAHIRSLADSGFHAILPDQLYQYIISGTPLPRNPVMLTFDDSHEEHYTTVAPLLEQYGFKGVFFIMNVTINKKGYLKASQIMDLSQRGHVIGSHSWDHRLVTRLSDADWEMQITRPKLQLEKITGKPVIYFAYPSGAWNEHAVNEISQRGIQAAFQLYGGTHKHMEQFAIRRMIVPGTWTPAKLHKQMRLLFGYPG